MPIGLHGSSSRLARRLARDARGSVLTMFALVTPVMLAAGMGAVDYSRMAGQRSRLQAVSDALALKLAPLAFSKSDAQLAAEAARIVTAFDNTGALKVEPPQVSLARTEVTVRVSMDYTPVYFRVPGYSTYKVATLSKAAVSNTTYEIALVLDNSSSMADMSNGRSKVDAAKEAAGTLVDTIMDEPDMARRTRIALVPYTSSVHVGSEHQTASWVDTQGASKIHWENITKPAAAVSRFALFDWLGEPWGGCFETRPDGLGLTDDGISADDPSTLFVPMFAPDEPGNKLASSYSNQQVLNSYLNDDGQGACPLPLPAAWADRQKLGCKYKIDKNTSKIAFSYNWGIRTGPNFMCNAVKMLRLTDNRSALKGRIGEMKALGDTSIFEGVAWGWRALSPNAPFADGRAYGGNVDNRKILILLSDGNNNWLRLSNANRSLYSPMGFYINNRVAAGLTDQSVANATLDNKTKQVCENAKGKGVTIYTVGFVLPGKELPPSWSDLVTNCASPVGGKRQAYIASNGDQVVEIFREIARTISGVRLVQ
jgi:Flp pilus assembly protein TadG